MEYFVLRTAILVTRTCLIFTLWAICFWVGSWLALWQAKTGLFPPSPIPVWGYRLIIGCSGEKWEARALPQVFLLSFNFCVNYSCSCIQHNHHWDPSGQGRSRKLLLQLFFSEKGYANDRGMVLQVKLVLGLIVFPNWGLVMFGYESRRLPSVYLGRGWYKHTSP